MVRQFGGRGWNPSSSSAAAWDLSSNLQHFAAMGDTTRIEEYQCYTGSASRRANQRPKVCFVNLVTAVSSLWRFELRLCFLRPSSFTSTCSRSENDHMNDPLRSLSLEREHYDPFPIPNTGMKPTLAMKTLTSKRPVYTTSMRAVRGLLHARWTVGIEPNYNYGVDIRLVFVLVDFRTVDCGIVKL